MSERLPVYALHDLLKIPPELLDEITALDEKKARTSAEQSTVDSTIANGVNNSLRTLREAYLMLAAPTGTWKRWDMHARETRFAFAGDRSRTL